MKTPRSYLVSSLYGLMIGLILWTCSGCETLIDASQETGPDLLAVQGVFNPAQSAWRVEVQPVLPLGSTAQSQFSLSEADVTIWQEGNIIARLAHVERGLYEGDGPTPEPGRRYRLEVELDGYPSLSAESIVPVRVNDVHVAFQDSSGFSGSAVTGDALPSATLNLKFQDDAELVNHYQVRIVEKNGVSEERFFESQHPSFPRENLREIISSDGVDRPVFLNPVFTDELFSGEVFDADLNIIRSPTFAYRVLLRHMSEELYRFSLSQALLGLDEENPFAEPVITYSNVEGGIGIFAGYVDQEAPPVVLDEITPERLAGRYTAVNFQYVPNMDVLRAGGTLELQFEPNGMFTGQVLIPAQISPDGTEVSDQINGQYTITEGLITFMAEQDLFLNRLQMYYRQSGESAFLQGVFPNPDSVLTTLFRAAER